MELVWAVIKIIEYLVLSPVWWLATTLAAAFYPFEGDSRHSLLATLFSVIILGLLIWGCIFLFK